MSIWGGRDNDLIDLIIPDQTWPAPPGYAAHAGQRGDRLADPYAPKPGSRPVVHKDPLIGTWSHGGGAADRRRCEVCTAEFGDRA